MSTWLKDKVAVVTGSGEGIGRAIALAMAAAGARVVTNNRKPGSVGGDAETAAKEIVQMGGKAVPFFGDVSKFGDAEALIRTAVDNFGRLDILVNNAATFVFSPIWAMTEQEWDTCLDVSLKGAFNCSRCACAFMKEQRWGRILNATSGAWLGTFEHCNYAAAKAGIVGLTGAIARDMGRFGVTCNAFSPSALTRLTLSKEMKANRQRAYEAGVISKNVYESRSNKPPPEMIPPLLIYLCTDTAANINGQVFQIDGGKIAIYAVEAKNAINKEKGLWTTGELMNLMPKVVLAGYKNPAPAQPSGQTAVRH